jgi:hypothetical protein
VRRHAAVRDLPDLDGSGDWCGLSIDVDAPRRPGLRVEATTGRRMLLRQGERPLLFARVTGDAYGVNVLGARPIRSPISPCRADRARVRAESGDPSAAWAHAFATELATELATAAGAELATAAAEPGAAAVAGPLHRGRWILTRHETAGMWRQARPPEGWLAISRDGDGHINWFTSPCVWDVVPLRPLSAPDSPRVKAYRKQARDGVLPPVLLWWISGLCCHVLLDGHDRFAAAMAEGRDPAMLVLGLAGDDREKALATGWAVRHHARATAHVDAQVAAGTAHPHTGYVAVDRRLGEALAGIARFWGRTRSWPVRGAVPAWREQAAAVDAGWCARNG